jgi:hypothetical protein
VFDAVFSDAGVSSKKLNILPTQLAALLSILGQIAAPVGRTSLELAPRLTTLIFKAHIIGLH